MLRYGPYRLSAGVFQLLGWGGATAGLNGYDVCVETDDSGVTVEGRVSENTQVE